MFETKKLQGFVISIGFLVVMGGALGIPFIVSGPGQDKLDDVVLQPRYSPTPTPLSRALTQQAFAALFFTPTSSPKPTDAGLAFLLPITGATATSTPTLTSTATITLTASLTPTRTRFPFYLTLTAGAGSGGNGSVPSVYPSNTPITPTATPQPPTSTLAPSPTDTPEPPPTDTPEPPPTDPPPTDPP